MPNEIRALPDQGKQVFAPFRRDLVVEDVGQRGAKHALPVAMLALEGRRLLLPFDRISPIGRRGADSLSMQVPEIAVSLVAPPDALG